MTIMNDPAIGVDVGGTNVRAALVSRDLSLSGENRRRIDKSSPTALLEVMAACVEQAMKAAPGAAGIGVAMKGYVDVKTGITIASGNLGMKNVPVGPYLAKRFGVPVRVANDVQVATTGEMLYGAGRDYKDFIYLNVGTGIAAGMVLDGRLYGGASNLAGELGHMTVDRDGPQCPCGQKGCLEEIVSGPGIVAQARIAVSQYPGSVLAPLAESGQLTASKVFALADRGDEAAMGVLRKTAEYLGDGIVNLINLLNPAAVILGGGVFTDAATFIRLLETHVRTHAIGQAARSLRAFETSRLDVDKVGIIGAAAMVFQAGQTR